MTEPTLLLDGSWGIYIPQMFATRHLTGADCLRCGIPVGDAMALADPENSLYWEAWDSVLGNYRTESGETLHQDGDLWLVPDGFEWPQD